MNISRRLKKLNKSLHRLSLFHRVLISLLPLIAALQFLILPALTQQTVTVKVFLNGPESVWWKPFIQDFEAKNPEINLEVVAGPKDSNLIEDLYTSAFLLGDSPYDLVYMDIVWVQKFAAAGWLMDLSEKAAKLDLSDYMPGDLQGGYYQGKLYRMPLRSDVGMLYYRTDLLKKTGYQPPETFDQLMTISQDLKQKNLVDWGYVWQGKQYEGLAAMFTEILEGYGAFWIQPDTLKVGLDQPQAIQAVEFLRSTIKKQLSPSGVTTYNEEDSRLLFQNGEVAFLRNWPYVYSLASNSKIAGKYAIKPMVHAPGYTSGACQGGWGLAISKLTQHPEAAWKVIDYFNTPEIQKKYILASGYPPARRSFFTDSELVAKYSYLPALLDVVENSVLRPPIPQYAQASDILQRYLSAALTDRMSPQQAMNAAAAETRRLLGQ